MKIENAIIIIIIILTIRTIFDDSIRNVFERRQRRKYLSSREMLSKKEAVQLMLKDPHLPYSDIDNILTCIGNTLNVDPCMLRPSDRLADLRGIRYHILKGDSEIDYLEDIIIAYQKKYNISDNEYLDIIGAKEMDEVIIGDIFKIIDSLHMYRNK